MGGADCDGLGQIVGDKNGGFIGLPDDLCDISGDV